MKLSSAEESYILTIHQLSNGENVSTNDLANQLGVAAASVTDMIRKLADKEFIRYEKYRGVRLLPTGVKVAKQLSQTKQLWQEFIESHLEITGDEMNDLVEQLQHVQSPRVKEQLRLFLASKGKEIQLSELNFPTTIEASKQSKQELEPSKSLQNTHALRLTDAVKGQRYFLLGIDSIDLPILPLLAHFSLQIGAEIRLVEVVEFDQSILIQHQSQQMNLSNRLAEKLLIAPQ